MRIRLAAAILALAALVVSPQTSPAGPGDSDPVGPGPHVVVHAPASVSWLAKSIVVWVHSHNMPDGIDTEVFSSRGSCVILDYSINEVDPGQWDEMFKISTKYWNLQSGQSIGWTAAVLNLDDDQTYYGYATTQVN